MAPPTPEASFRLDGRDRPSYCCLYWGEQCSPKMRVPLEPVNGTLFEKKSLQMESCYGENRLDQGGPTTMAVTQHRGSGGPRDPRGRGWRGVATNWDARSQRDLAGEPRARVPGGHLLCPGPTHLVPALLGPSCWGRLGH